LNKGLILCELGQNMEWMRCAEISGTGQTTTHGVSMKSLDLLPLSLKAFPFFSFVTQHKEKQ